MMISHDFLSMKKDIIYKVFVGCLILCILYFIDNKLMCILIPEVIRHTIVLPEISVQTELLQVIIITSL